MAFQLGTERFLDGIANYLIIFGLCLRINQSPGHEQNDNQSHGVSCENER